jgi:hypothetical protein
VNNFREQLYEHNVKLDTKLDAMIRKNEAGDSITYKDFGKHIFRNLNG